MGEKFLIENALEWNSSKHIYLVEKRLPKRAFDPKFCSQILGLCPVEKKFRTTSKLWASEFELKELAPGEMLLHLTKSLFG
jgi:hypothetical protein